MLKEKAIFGAGCFWGVEEAFRTLPGVLETRVGYAGGQTENPDYESVCHRETGHAEVVEVTFDGEQIAYDQLLQVFFDIHDPTQLNRQGPDIGTQYRSVIFTQSQQQKEMAKSAIQTAQTQHEKPVVTRIEDAPTFWEAEDYHQKYLLKRGRGSCFI